MDQWRVGHPVLGDRRRRPRSDTVRAIPARTEVETLRPAVTVLLEDLTSSPHVVVGRIDDPDAATAVEELLAHAGTFDVTAAWVVHVCRKRAWPALSADPGRLHRIDPDVPVDLL